MPEIADYKNALARILRNSDECMNASGLPTDVPPNLRTFSFNSTLLASLSFGDYIINMQ